MLACVHTQENIQFVVDKLEFQTLCIIKLYLHVYIGKVLLKLRNKLWYNDSAPGGTDAKIDRAPYPFADVAQFIDHTVLQRLHP